VLLTYANLDYNNAIAWVLYLGARLSELEFLEARASRIFLMSEWEFIKVKICKSDSAKFLIFKIISQLQTCVKYRSQVS